MCEIIDWIWIMWFYYGDGMVWGSCFWLWFGVNCVYGVDVSVICNKYVYFGGFCLYWGSFGWWEKVVRDCNVLYWIICRECVLFFIWVGMVYLNGWMWFVLRRIECGRVFVGYLNESIVLVRD